MRGAVGIAKKFRISALVVGMTVVSFGTSAPELVVSLMAAVGGSSDIAVGNIVGSNIANIALVLGFTALIFPIAVSRDSIRINWTAMMLATLLFYLLILNGWLSLWEGVLSVALLMGFIFWLVRRSRKEHAAEEKTAPGKKVPLARHITFVSAGCVALVFGADWLIDGAVTIAKTYHISERVIGITVAAFGTSLPELVTSCVAAFKKQADISIGNLIGSNLFNILAILGITSIVIPLEINPAILHFDVFWLLGISALILPLMYFGRSISRAKGALLVLVYVIYIFLLF